MTPTRPGRVRADLNYIRAVAEEVAVRAKDLARDYEEAHDAYVRSFRSGVRSLPRGGGVGDPTGDTATAGDYRRMQSVLRFVDNRVSAARSKMVSALRELERALGDDRDGLLGAWLDTDPDLRDDRREKRAAVRAATVEATGTE